MFDPVLARKSACIGALMAAFCVLALTACGSGSSSSAPTLLRQTFSGPHKVNSGNLSFSLTVTPTGSSTLTQPITLAFGGPFQSLGTGKLPESDFTVSITAQGHSGALSIISTGTKGFVSLSGTSYQLPAASFQKLESSFSSIASTGGSQPSLLGRLGVDPLGWLSKPTVIGQESVGGTETTHIRAAVNVTALLRGLNTFLQKAGSLGVSGASSIPSSISAATQAKIASEVQQPTFDVWTGNSDKTVRQLRIGLTFPVSGELTTLLGGLNKAVIALTLRYTDLNQPQTITAPTKLQPYSVFSSKLAGLVEAVEGSLSSGAALGSGTTGSGSAGTSGTTGSGSAGTTTGSSSTGTTGTSSAAGATNSYSQCITAAGQNVSKMQKCASLLNSSSG